MGFAEKVQGACTTSARALHKKKIHLSLPEGREHDYSAYHKDSLLLRETEMGLLSLAITCYHT